MDVIVMCRFLCLKCVSACLHEVSEESKSWKFIKSVFGEALEGNITNHGEYSFIYNSREMLPWRTLWYHSILVSVDPSIPPM